MTNPVDDLGNVKVDFVWGNIPMQPDDQRGENTLDPALDNHIIATSGYQGFPTFTRGGVFDDTVENALVPNVVGLTESAATTALTNVGLVKGAVTTANNAAGATEINNGKIKTQSIASGTTVNTGSSVALVKYEYVAPVVALYGPTTNWAIGLTGTSSQMWLFGSGGTFSALSVVAANEAGYKIVITGGTIAGEYTIGEAYYDFMVGGYYLGGTSVTPTRIQGSTAPSSLTVDAGSVSIVAV